jgi:hypothetical protein
MSSLNQPVPRTFSPGETEVGAYMNASVRDAVNAILNPPHFRASITNGATLTANANIAWPSVEDNYSGWNSSSNYWVVPATWSGLYTVEVRFKWNGTAPTSAPAINVFKNGTKVLASANASSTSGFAGVSLTDRLRVVAGDQIAVQIGNAGFVCQTDTGDNNTFNFGFYCM